MQMNRLCLQTAQGWPGGPEEQGLWKQADFDSESLPFLFLASCGIVCPSSEQREHFTQHFGFALNRKRKAKGFAPGPALGGGVAISGNPCVLGTLPPQS